MKPLVGLMVRVLQVMLRLTVWLVMLMVTPLQVMVLGVGPRVGDRWPVLSVGLRQSWQRVLWGLLAGLSPGPGGVCRLRWWSGSSPILAEGAHGDVHGWGLGGDATVYSVPVDADGEGAVGDVPGGGAVGEGAAVDATGDGATGVADGDGVAAVQ